MTPPWPVRLCRTRLGCHRPCRFCLRRFGLGSRINRVRLGTAQFGQASARPANATERAPAAARSDHRHFRSGSWVGAGADGCGNTTSCDPRAMVAEGHRLRSGRGCGTGTIVGIGRKLRRLRRRDPVRHRLHQKPAVTDRWQRRLGARYRGRRGRSADRCSSRGSRRSARDHRRFCERDLLRPCRGSSCGADCSAITGAVRWSEASLKCSLISSRICASRWMLSGRQARRHKRYRPSR